MRVLTLAREPKSCRLRGFASVEYGEVSRNVKPASRKSPSRGCAPAARRNVQFSHGVGMDNASRLPLSRCQTERPRQGWVRKDVFARYGHYIHEPVSSRAPLHESNPLERLGGGRR